jgi:hypothetical protein
MDFRPAIDADPSTSAHRNRELGVVVREVVDRAAPEQREFVDGLNQLGTEAALERLAKSPARGEQLGFGVESVAVLVSPVLYIVLDQALRKIVDDSIDGARRRWGRRRRPDVVVPVLSAAQIAAIRSQVVDAARKQGVSGDKIECVGEAVVQVLSEPADGPDRDPPGSSG